MCHMIVLIGDYKLVRYAYICELLSPLSRQHDSDEILFQSCFLFSRHHLN